MFWRRKKPLCVIGADPTDYTMGEITSSDVHRAVVRTLREAGLDEDAEAYDARFWELLEMGREKRGDFSTALERLTLEYVRVRVVDLK